ncbi:MAG TPA: endolytic transglycosylase MltG [Vulgatibacter sp.]|nr:endolytic transglycosylase MltG [Vulgatibacter sp.]
MKKLLAVSCLLAIVAGAGAYVWLERAVHTPLRPDDDASIEITVPRGATGRSIFGLLEREGLVEDRIAWRYHLWRRGGLAVKAGRHALSPAMELAEIATALEGAPLPDDVPFVMIEGWRLRDTDAALAKEGWIRPGAYVEAASDPSRFRAEFPLPSGTLEGYLYPETYSVVPDRFDVDELVQRQLDTFAARLWRPHRAELEASGRSLHEIVIMASLLEREEPVPAQRDLVAGILWKRIDARQPLGVDATSRYLLAEWNDRRAFLAKLRDPSDPWNTRTRAGLPPGPIGAPTIESLLAAMRPKSSPYWYYLHDADRVLRPSRNAAEHEALRKRYNVY